MKRLLRIYVIVFIMSILTAFVIREPVPFSELDFGGVPMPLADVDFKDVPWFGPFGPTPAYAGDRIREYYIFTTIPPIQLLFVTREYISGKESCPQFTNNFGDNDETFVCGSVIIIEIHSRRDEAKGGQLDRIKTTYPQLFEKTEKEKKRKEKSDLEF